MIKLTHPQDGSLKKLIIEKLNAKLFFSQS